MHLARPLTCLLPILAWEHRDIQGEAQGSRSGSPDPWACAGKNVAADRADGFLGSCDATITLRVGILKATF